MARTLLCAALVAAAMAAPLSAQTFSFNTGDASLDVTLNSLNVSARADIGPFTADMSASFGVSQPQVQAWINVERLQPAEVFLALEIGKIAARPPAVVIETYKKNRGKGWGAVARSLGIKPGSPQFKALKAATSEKNEKIKARGKKK